jgi:phosphoglycolate phosphatase
VKYKLAMFDFDGTLADTFPWFLSAVTWLADKHGFNRIEAGELGTLRGYSAHKIVERLGIPAWRLRRIGIDRRRLMAEDIRQIRLFDGIGAMLQGLSDRGVALAVVTSKAYDNVRHRLGVEHASLICYYECGTSHFGKRGELRRVLKQSGVG